jgi:hypothetical protein
MPARTLILSLLLLAASAAAQDKPKQPQAVRTSTVYFREDGATEWSLFGYYETEASARNVFDHLERGGYQVKLEITNTPIPRPEPISRKAPVKLPASETVSLDRATEVFRDMARQDDIAFRYPVDGCYARAELMVELMLRQGLKPRKVWAVASGEELVAKTKNHPKGYVTWAYHVAPVLRVRGADDEQRWYVIDPSLFTAPVTLTAWMKAQMRPEARHQPFLTITRPGQAPKWIDNKVRAGSGYWPGRDPKEGPHVHAVSTMKKYKPFEGKVIPKKTGRLGIGRPSVSQIFLTNRGVRQLFLPSPRL